jgi:hypothetical protein
MEQVFLLLVGNDEWAVRFDEVVLVLAVYLE